MSNINLNDDATRKRLMSLRIEAINKLKPTTDDLYGYCADISIYIWNKLGKPNDLYPYSVMFGGGEEHVILYDKKNDWAFDPTCNQFGSEEYFNFDPRTTYDDFEKIDIHAINATLEDIAGKL